MRIGEDLVEYLSKMGHETGDTVKLKVRNLDTNETSELADVAMTEENLQQVFRARIEQEKK